MIYPNSNLPTVSQSWGRAIQKGIESLEATIKSNEINNKARDTQLQANYVQTNKNIQDIKFALTSSGIAVTGVNEIKNAIYVPGTTQINGNSIQTGTFSASKITSGTIDAATVEVKNLNASKITTGSLSGDFITGGVITGTTLQTALTGGVRISNDTSSVSFRNGSTTVGHILPLGTNGVIIHYGSAPDASAGTFPQMYVGSGNVSIAASVNNYIGINSSGVAVQGPAFLYGNVNASVNLTVDGRIINPGGYNAVVSNATNMYIAANGAIARTTTTSSREAKQNIRNLEFNSNDFMSVSPVVFDYKDGIITEGNGDDIIGFIAEDFQDLGFTELITPKESEQDYIGLRYEKLYMYLHKVVQEQRSTIESLTARIEALESKV